MSDGEHTPDSEQAEVEESTGDAALDERLSQPVFTGHGGLDKAQVGISAFLVILVGAIAFSNTLGIPLHYADQQAIVENESLHRVLSVSDGWDAYGMRPIAALSVALNWQVGGGSPFLFHFINLCIHLFNGVLVYLLCRRLLRKVQPEAIAMVGGMLFVLHPAVTQSVNLVLNRSILLSTFFILLTLVLYLRATCEKDTPDVMGLGASLLCFALAWGCHVMAWVTPLLLFFVDAAAARGKVGLRPRALTQTPYWVVLVLLLIVHAESGAFGDAGPRSLSQAMGQVSTFTAYVPAIFYPVQLSVEHPPFEATGLPIVWAVSVVIAIGLFRFLPVVGLAVLWVLATAVASSFFIADTSLSEERLYLPLAGAVLVAPWLLNLVPRTRLRTIAGGVAAVLVLTLGTLTFFRNQVWQTEDGLWTDAALACPDCAEPPARLGSLRVDAGDGLIEFAQQAALQNNTEQFNIRDQEAQAEFETAEQFLLIAVQQADPSIDTWRDLGKSQRFLNKFDASRTAYLEVLAINPADQGATIELAALYNDKVLTGGTLLDRQAALDYYRRARVLGPLPVSTLLDYCGLLVAVGDYSTAGGALNAIVDKEGNPQVQTMLTGLQSVYGRVVNLNNQIAQLATANPSDPEIQSLQATKLYIQGDYLSTAYLVEKIFRERGPNLSLWTVLGLAKAKMGVLPAFIQAWGTPPTQPGVDAPWLHLARAAAQNNQWEAALHVVQHATVIGEVNAPSLIVMGDLALALQNVQRAGAYYQAAAQQVPIDPAPILRMIDLAFASGITDRIAALLTEAQRRGAPKSTIEEIRVRAGIEEADIGRPVQTIIQ